MNIDKILASIPGQSTQARADSRTNAEHLLATGTGDQQAAAALLIAALDAQAAVEDQALYERLTGLPVARRVLAAFRAAPMTENERKTIQALLDNPRSTSTELSQACGHDNMIWQMHFGNLCKERQAYLWPAVKAEGHEAPFFSGILATVDSETNRFTMKPDVVAAFAELGLKARPR